MNTIIIEVNITLQDSLLLVAINGSPLWQRGAGGDLTVIVITLQYQYSDNF
jgi:hypothetical protein